MLVMLNLVSFGCNSKLFVQNQGIPLLHRRSLSPLLMASLHSGLLIHFTPSDTVATVHLILPPFPRCYPPPPVSNCVVLLVSPY